MQRAQKGYVILRVLRQIFWDSDSGFCGLLLAALSAATFDYLERPTLYLSKKKIHNQSCLFDVILKDKGHFLMSYI